MLRGTRRTTERLWSVQHQHGAVGAIYNLFRDAAQQETTQALPPIGTYHDEVVVLAYLTDCSDGITYENISRHREVWTGHYLGCIVYDLFSPLPTLSRNNIALDNRMLANHMR